MKKMIHAEVTESNEGNVRYQGDLPELYSLLTVVVEGLADKTLQLGMPAGHVHELMMVAMMPALKKIMDAEKAETQ